MEEESLALFREVDDTFGIATSLVTLAIIAIDQGKSESASSLLECV